MNSAIRMMIGIGTPSSHNSIERMIGTPGWLVDAARKAASYTSLWMFIALLVGAFSATFAATVGGRLRDGVYA